MFDIGCLFGSIYANGCDQSVITSLQANESWLTCVPQYPSRSLADVLL